MPKIDINDRSDPRVDLVLRLLENGIDAFIKDNPDSTFEDFLAHVKAVAAEEKAKNA